MNTTLKRVLSALLAVMLLASCFSVAALADDATETPTMTGESSISVHSAADTSNTASRTFYAYQIFYGTGGTGDKEGTLSNVQWGVSLKGKTESGEEYNYISDLITNINNSDNADLISKFGGVTANTEASVIAEKMVGLSSESTIAFTQAVADIINTSGYKGQVAGPSAASDNTAEGGHNYTISGLHHGYYLVIETGFKSDKVTVNTENGTEEVDTTNAADKSTYSRMILRVVSTDTTAVIKTTDTPTVSKIIKNSTLKDSQGNSYSRYDTASIDETKTFVLSSAVPNMTGYKKYYFVFNDTMSKGLNFDAIQNVTIYPSDSTADDSKAIKLYDKTDSENSSVAGSHTYQIEVTYTNSEGNSVTYDASDETIKSEYHNDEHSETKLAIIFNDFIQYKEYAGWTVEIEYTGYLNHNAEIGDPSTTDGVNNAKGETNSVYLTYSNNPNVTDSGDKDNEDKPAGSGVKDTEVRTVYLYTSGLDLIKVNDNNAGGHRLTGATFKITNAEGSSRLATVVEETKTYSPAGYLSDSSFTLKEGTDYYLQRTDGAFVLYKSKEAIDTANVKPENVKYGVKENGSVQNASDYEIRLDGGYYKKSGTLSAGEFSYIESASADSVGTYEQDYLLYTMTSEVNPIEKSVDTVEYYVTVGDDGKVELEGLAAGTYIITETVAPNGYNILTEPIILTVKFQEPATDSTSHVGLWTFSATMGGTDLSEQFTGAELRVVNKKGSTLPSTGGIGTTIFYIVGTILVLGAGVLLITRKRMKDSQ
jgi:fimbrial isopeptide formation D2 family protein/LPXTG-motif cell wall-anchored protein